MSKTQFIIDILILFILLWALFIIIIPHFNLLEQLPMDILIGLWVILILRRSHIRERLTGLRK